MKGEWLDAYQTGGKPKLTKDTVEKCIGTVIVPAASRTIIDLNLVRDIEINKEEVKVNLASTALNEGTQKWLIEKVKVRKKNKHRASTIYLHDWLF